MERETEESPMAAGFHSGLPWMAGVDGTGVREACREGSLWDLTTLARKDLTASLTMTDVEPKSQDQSAHKSHRVHAVIG